MSAGISSNDALKKNINVDLRIYIRTKCDISFLFDQNPENKWSSELVEFFSRYNLNYWMIQNLSFVISKNSRNDLLTYDNDRLLFENS